MVEDNIVRSRYLDKIFGKTQLKETVKQAISHLDFIKEKTDFDFIAFTGNSGAGLCFILNYITNYDIVLVRKSSDRTHGYEIEGANLFCENKKYLIIDDLIESGNTIRFITSKLFDRYKLNCCGVYLYNDHYIIESVLNGFLFPVYSFNGVQLNQLNKGIQ